MANNLALGLVIGGAVSSSVGKAFGDVESRIKRLEDKGAKSRVLQSVIGETKRLQDEWRKAHATGSATADGLRNKLENNLNVLKRQGVEVRNLDKAYRQMDRAARSSELKAKGQSQIREGGAGLRSTGGKVAAGAAALVVPTMVAANYQAQIRQMALWAHTAGTGDEAKLAKSISDVAAAKGMSQQALAEAVGGLIEKGIDWEESAGYAGLIADLVDGQGMEKDTIATLFSAFKEAGVQKEDMGAMLGQVAAAGDIGAFGPKDMAKYMPPLLGTIKRLGMEGPEAVRFLGASLQSQYKQTQDSASAATNMNNLLNAVISSTSQERFAKEGYDLAASINSLTKSGKAENPVDAFIMLTSALVKKQDPAKAKQVEALKAKIRASKDGTAEQEQAMVSLIQAAGLANIVSDQSASDGLLAQIKYGSNIKSDMVTIKETDGKAKIEADAAKAREVSRAKWKAATASIEGSMESIGRAILPITDRVADGLTSVLGALKKISDESPVIVSGAVAIGGAVAAVVSAIQAFKIARGVMNIGRGSLMGNPNVVQKVQVVNGLGGSGSSGGPDLGDVSHERDKRTKGRKPGRGGGAAPSTPPSSAKPRLQVYSDGTRVQAKPTPLSSWKPPTETPKALAPAASALPKSGGMRPGSFAKGSLPFVLLDAGFQAKDVYDNAETRDEKAEGYGSVAGNVAGTLAGAAAGAAIGSVVPIIGTVIGGLIGGYLGSMGGTALGGYAGKAAFGSPTGTAAGAGPVTPLLMGPRPGPPVPSLATMAGSFASASAANASEYKPQPLDPSVSYDPSNPDSADPFLMKNPYGKKVRFPGASQVNDPERLAAMESMRKALAPAPMVAPSAVTGNGPSSAVPDMNALANSFKASDGKAPIPAMMAPIKAATPSGPPKVEQQNTFSPVFQITVQGDAKDPQKLAQEMMPEIQRMMSGMAQQSARSSNYDEPHV